MMSTGPKNSQLRAWIAVSVRARPWHTLAWLGLLLCSWGGAAEAQHCGGSLYGSLLQPTQVMPGPSLPSLEERPALGPQLSLVG